MLALLFPGQGSQRPGMGAPWQGHPSWKLTEEVADASGRDVASLLLDVDTDTLKATRNAQLAAFTLSLVILDAARAEGLDQASVVAGAGHSLGEYSALVAVGVLSVAEGARLVAARGEAMQAAADVAPGTMAAILGLDADLVVQSCADVEGSWVANDNAPGQIVIAGTASGVDAAGANAKKRGAKRVMALAVGGAFHSPLMASAQSDLDSALAAATWGGAHAPVVANVDAVAHDDGWSDLLSRQLVSPVRWRESMLALPQLGVTITVELGPGSELSGMVKRTLDGVERAHVAKPEDLAAVAGLGESR
ncbi:MAG: ACP S-malonyltransferase [Actinomycetota bacterium]|nr:ACP S-malonyltransferase [Actinomycetota bacterium]